MISQRAHAEFDVCAADEVVVLPPAIAAHQPFPGEPLACAVNAMKRAGVAPGQRVAVVGMGFMGLALVQLCATRAGELAAISRRSGALTLAESLGATSTW